MKHLLVIILVGAMLLAGGVFWWSQDSGTANNQTGNQTGQTADAADPNSQAEAEQLGWSEQEAQEIVTPSLRKYLATGYINDPMAGLIDYFSGKIGSNHGYYSGPPPPNLVNI